MMATDAKYLVFFDVDHTLIRGSTATAFGIELLRAGIVGIGDALMVGVWNALYKLGLISEVEIWHQAIRRLMGKPEPPIREACFTAHERRVRFRLYQEGLETLERHRERGAVPALISAGPRYSVYRLADLLGIAQELTSTCWAEIKDGVVMGLNGQSIPYGPMKRVFAEAYCRRFGIDPAVCWAYGDSRSDIEMLEFVGHPVAVNPKAALRRIARARGWPIVHWGQTARQPVS